MAHQSTLLMQGLNSEEGMDAIVLLQEIEELKRALEEERNQHNLELNSLQVSDAGCWQLKYIIYVLFNAKAGLTCNKTRVTLLDSEVFSASYLIEFYFMNRKMFFTIM